MTTLDINTFKILTYQAFPEFKLKTDDDGKKNNVE
jgi:hypothetical protein